MISIGNLIKGDSIYPRI